MRVRVNLVPAGARPMRRNQSNPPAAEPARTADSLSPTVSDPTAAAAVCALAPSSAPLVPDGGTRHDSAALPPGPETLSEHGFPSSPARKRALVHPAVATSALAVKTSWLCRSGTARDLRLRRCGLERCCIVRCRRCALYRQCLGGRRQCGLWYRNRSRCSRFGRHGQRLVCFCDSPLLEVDVMVEHAAKTSGCPCACKIACRVQCPHSLTGASVAGVVVGVIALQPYGPISPRRAQ